MVKRSDNRERMVGAARQLYQERGYFGTAFSDVLELTGAPRGSVYHHFPGGKDQLAREVVQTHHQATIEGLDRLATRCADAEEFVAAFLHSAQERLVRMNYREGCPIAAIVVESPLGTPELAQTARRAVGEVVDHLTGILVGYGEPEPRARSRALATLAAYEGALIIARATGSPDAFAASIEALHS